MNAPAAQPAWRGLPRGVWVLGLVSMFMDVSSEMIHALLPIYLVSAMGASVLMVGLVEGVAEAVAAGTRLFSGALSDRLGRRKGLVLLGYGLAALAKPVFPLASTIGWIAAARFVDRLGKGIRGAPRDALVADITPPDRRGAAFGLRQSLDNVGAVIGPLAAILLMAATGDDFRTVFWLAALPAALAVALVLFGVREPDRPPRQDPTHPEPAAWPAGIAELEGAFWGVVAVAVVFTLARFSEAFLILRAQSAGLPIYLAPVVLVAMNVAYALSAYPAGLLSDRWGRQAPLAAGCLLLVAADLMLGMATGLAAVGAGILLWGLQMGLTQGILAAMIADAAPAGRRGTAFGLYNLLTGVALLAASVVAGLLWDRAGPAATFQAGAAFAATALAGLLAQAVWRRQAKGRDPER